MQLEVFFSLPHIHQQLLRRLRNILLCSLVTLYSQTMVNVFPSVNLLMYPERHRKIIKTNPKFKVSPSSLSLFYWWNILHCRGKQGKNSQSFTINLLLRAWLLLSAARTTYYFLWLNARLSAPDSLGRDDEGSDRVKNVWRRTDSKFSLEFKINITFKERERKKKEKKKAVWCA